MNKNKLIPIITAIAVLGIVAACNDKDEVKEKKAGFDSSREISVITREAGSGTRDAFVELAGILIKQNGKKKDITTKEALTIDGTQGVMSTVAGNDYAIGYISLGSLNQTVKAMKINGISPQKINVKNGTYPISRPFNIVTKEEVIPLAQDFIDFILSSSGQKVVDENGYVSVSEGKLYKSKKLTGKLIIAGSSSVSPVMEKLKEAYMKLNPGVEIEIQTNDSSSGILATKEGTCDIGISSRDLKKSEAESLKSLAIARDGIAIIVNKKNPKEAMTLMNLREVYTGSVRNWNSL